MNVRQFCLHLLVCAFAASAAVTVGASSTAARSLDAIKSRGTVMMCANPNALPFSSKKGDRRGVDLELGEVLAKELGVGLEVGWVVMTTHVSRVDCDIVFDTIVDKESADDAHLRLSKPYNVSGVAIALRPGIDGIKSFDDLKKGQRVGALVGSVASVRLGKNGLPTIPFNFEDDMVDAVGKGELDAALVTPATIGYYNLMHQGAPVTLVPAYEGVPELRWEVAVGMRKADDALVSAVNTALDRLLEQGVVKRIYANYGIEQSLPGKP